MTLTLVDPSPAAVVVHAGGMISVRCADFPGGARGDLSSGSDALAAAGTALREEQELAVATSTTGSDDSDHFAAASDTFRVTVSDLGFETQTTYEPFLSLRTEGDPPANAVTGQRWAMFDGRGYGPGIGFGLDDGGGVDYFGAIREPPTSIFPHYVIRSFEFGQFGLTDPTDELVIRAWGMTGGDLAWLLDTLYFFPVGDFAFPARNLHTYVFPQSELPFFGNNGNVFGVTADDDATGLPFGTDGDHSVLLWQRGLGIDADGWGQISEFQDDDVQPTSQNTYGYGDLFGFPGRCRLFVPVGVTHIPATTILTDDFSTEQHIDPTYGAHYTADIGGPYLRDLGLGGAGRSLHYWDNPPPLGIYRGTHVDAGDGFATTWFGPDNVGAPDGYALSEWDGYQGWIRYGGSLTAGGFDAFEPTTDPRNHRKKLEDLEFFTASCRSCVIDFAGDAGFSVGTASFVADVDEHVSARLNWEAGGGDITMSIWAGSNFLTWNRIAGPVTVGSGWSLGDWWWVKVEKRGYFWRARAWEDGTTEPSTWDVEGLQPLYYGGGGVPIYHPWETNWLGNLGHDNAYLDPRGGNSSLTSAGHTVNIFTEVKELQQRMRILTADVTIEVDPGGSSPGDGNLRLTKYDDTTDYGTVSIPYGAHRMVIAGLDDYMFDDDENGFAVRAWKDAGSPAMDYVAMSRILRRTPLGVTTFVPQIYRRIVSG